MNIYEQSKNKKTEVFISMLINITFHIKNLRDEKFSY